MTAPDLKQYLVEAKIITRELAEKIGMNPNTLRGKLSGNTLFLPGEIDKAFEAAREINKQKQAK